VIRDAGDELTLFLLDACQSVGQMPIDVQAIGCHMMCATGRKYLRAPRGTGFLYVCQALLMNKHLLDEPPMINHHSAKIGRASFRTYRVKDSAQRYEMSEKNVAIRLGLGAAVDYILTIGTHRIYERIQMLARTLRIYLSALPNVKVHEIGENLCGIVTFTVENLTSPEVHSFLRERHQTYVAVSAHDAAPVDFEQHHLSSLVRVSLHVFNTVLEIHMFAAQVARLAASHNKPPTK
jgi:cysteine desulfurase/selenocysteine lyase